MTANQCKKNVKRLFFGAPRQPMGCTIISNFEKATWLSLGISDLAINEKLPITRNYVSLEPAR